jgi:ribosome-associated toxin RatA of RatAB toxin-antitoxin module
MMGADSILLLNGFSGNSGGSPSVSKNTLKSRRLGLFQWKNVLPTALNLGLVMTLAWSNPAWSKTVSEADTLSGGQVVVKQYQSADHNGVPSVEARILIARPPSKVWSVVSNPEVLMQNEPKVKKVKILSRSQNRQNVEFNVLMTHLLPSFNYVLVQELSPPNLLRFHRLSGSFKDIQGSWKLVSSDEGRKTILSYTLMIDPGPFIPRGLLLGAVKSDLPNMMKNAKLAIDKNTQ